MRNGSYTSSMVSRSSLTATATSAATATRGATASLIGQRLAVRREFERLEGQVIGVAVRMWEREAYRFDAVPSLTPFLLIVACLALAAIPLTARAVARAADALARAERPLMVIGSQARTKMFPVFGASPASSAGAGPCATAAAADSSSNASREPVAAPDEFSTKIRTVLKENCAQCHSSKRPPSERVRPKSFESKEGRYKGGLT